MRQMEHTPVPSGYPGDGGEASTVAADASQDETTVKVDRTNNEEYIGFQNHRSDRYVWPWELCRCYEVVR